MSSWTRTEPRSTSVTPLHLVLSFRQCRCFGPCQLTPDQSVVTILLSAAFSRLILSSNCFSFCSALLHRRPLRRLGEPLHRLRSLAAPFLVRSALRRSSEAATRSRSASAKILAALAIGELRRGSRVIGHLNNSTISSSGRDSSHPLLAAFRIRALLLQESAQ